MEKIMNKNDKKSVDNCEKIEKNRNTRFTILNTVNLWGVFRGDNAVTFKDRIHGILAFTSENDNERVYFKTITTSDLREGHIDMITSGNLDDSKTFVGIFDGNDIDELMNIELYMRAAS